MKPQTEVTCMKDQTQTGGTAMKVKRQAQGGVIAELKDLGKVQVSSINTLTKSAIVRIENKFKKVNLDSLDFGYVS